MSSIWRETVALPRFGPLKGDLHTDVLVVGGGMAGILCTHLLRERGVDCALVEAEHLAWVPPETPPPSSPFSTDCFIISCCGKRAGKGR